MKGTAVRKYNFGHVTAFPWVVRRQSLNPILSAAIGIAERKKMRFNEFKGCEIVTKLSI
jgi:hypothetical protein